MPELGHLCVRAISLLPSGTEMLYALGVAPLAVSHECDYPAAARDLPRATFSRVDSRQTSLEIDQQVRSLLAAGEPLYGIDAALITDLRPELIVTQAQCDVCAVRYQDVQDLVASSPVLARTKVVPLQPGSLSDVFADLLRIGAAIESMPAAQRVLNALQARRANVSKKVETLSGNPRPRTVIIEWTNPLMTAGNWTPELVTLAGGKNCLSEAGRHSGYVTWEDICSASPEVLVVAPCGFDLERSVAEAEMLRRLPGWHELPAVQAGRVWALDGNQYLNRSGPRLVDSLEILAHLLQPQLFPPPEFGDAFRKVL